MSRSAPTAIRVFSRMARVRCISVFIWIRCTRCTGINEAGPVEFQLKAPKGVTVTPASGVGPDVEAAADADPREFLIDVTAESVDQPLDLDVFYFACDDALTFCIPVNQSYQITLARDESHDWAIQRVPIISNLGGRSGRTRSWTRQRHAGPEKP